MKNVEWYVDWFNSPYYHLLYNNRNDDEANFFIDNLCSHLDLKPHAKVWDLACGKGRHSIALNKKGLSVVGTDLSENSIEEALKNSNADLDFYVHDMRTPFRTNNFDVVFNLFTSIGYFKNFRDNFSVFKNVTNSLKPEGRFVIDFFNAKKVVASMVASHTENRDGLEFEIKKTIVNNTIVKRIEFNCQSKNYFFEETVSLLTKQDFENFASNAGLKLLHIFGNYKLEAFNENTSDRLILIFKK